MGIAAKGDDAFIGQIKFFWTEDADDYPYGYIPCNGDYINSYNYPLLDSLLESNPDYNKKLPDCQDKVIIKYSDDIEFGDCGGDSDLPQFDIHQDHDIIVNHNQEKCDFRMFSFFFFLFFFLYIF